MKPWVAALLLFSFPLFAEDKAPPPPADPWSAISFLEGTWSARGHGSGAAASGSYTFKRELRGHLLSRESKSAECTGPKELNCEHSDRLFIYQDAPGFQMRMGQAEWKSYLEWSGQKQ